MVKRIRRNECFVTVTTRKANFAVQHFGKFTFWPSARAFKRGNCRGAVTYVNVYLGQDKARLETKAGKFIDRIIKEGRYPAK